VCIVHCRHVLALTAGWVISAVCAIRTGRLAAPVRLFACISTACFGQRLMDWLRCQMLLHCYERANAAYLDDFALYLYYILLAIETLLVVRILSLLFSPFWYSYFANQNCTCSRPQNEEFVYIFSNSRCSTNSAPKAKSDVYDCLFLLKFAFFKIGKIPLFQFRARVDFSDATDINKPVLSLIRRLST